MMLGFGEKTFARLARDGFDGGAADTDGPGAAWGGSGGYAASPLALGERGGGGERKRGREGKRKRRESEVGRGEGGVVWWGGGGGGCGGDAVLGGERLPGVGSRPAELGYSEV